MQDIDTSPPPAADPAPEQAVAPPPTRRRHRKRWIVLGIVVVLMTPVVWSYVTALTAPGSAPVSARTVEWFKDHGGERIVLWAENLWYSHHAPPTGGTPAGGIPVAGTQGTPVHGKHLPPHLAAPAPIAPIAAHPLPHEGHWQVVGRTADGLPTVRVAYLRPDAVHTSLVAGVMWMDTKLLHPVLVAGTQVPGSGTWPGGFQVPRSDYPALAASFNSGFLLRDSNGGFYLNGRAAAPLVNGQASFVIYKNGTADVGSWGSEVRMSHRVAAVRQNLWLLVDHGRLSPRLLSNPSAAWGATFSGGVLVWRSGVGVTKDGAIVYATGPGLSATSLAQLLVRAGAVRAMELDINTVWTNGYFYTNAPKTRWGFAPHPLLKDQYRPPTRYLVPDERDFFMMLLRPRFVKR